MKKIVFIFCIFLLHSKAHAEITQVENNEYLYDGKLNYKIESIENGENKVINFSGKKIFMKLDDKNISLFNYTFGYEGGNTITFRGKSLKNDTVKNVVSLGIDEIIFHAANDNDIMVLTDDKSMCYMNLVGDYVIRIDCTVRSAKFSRAGDYAVEMKWENTDRVMNLIN